MKYLPPALAQPAPPQGAHDRSRCCRSSSRSCSSASCWPSKPAFGMGVELAGNDRLVMIHKVSLIQPLPDSYARAHPRDAAASWTSATRPGSAASTRTRRTSSCRCRSTPSASCGCTRSSCCRRTRRRPGSPTGRARSSGAPRRSASAGRSATASRSRRRSGGKKDNSHDWEFNLRGIYDGDEQGTDTTQFFFHYEYFDEARLFGEGSVGWYVIRIADPAQGAADRASSSTQLFANSPAETKTDHREGVRRRRSRTRSATSALIIRVIVDGRVLHDPARRRQHDGAVGARAHERAGGAQDARLHRRPRARARAASSRALIAVVGGLLGPRDRLAGSSRRATRPAACCPASSSRPRGLARGSPWCVGFGVVAGHLPGAAGHAAAHRGRAAEGLSAWRSSQGSSRSCAVTALNLRTITRPPRLVRASPSSAWRASSPCSSPCCRWPRASGRRWRTPAPPDTAIVMRAGSDTEMTSILMREDVDAWQRTRRRSRGGRERAARLGRAVRDRRSREGEHRHRRERAAARRRAGRLQGAATSASSRAGCSQPGRNEIIVGRAAASQFAGLDGRVDAASSAQNDVDGRRDLRRGRHRAGLRAVVRRERARARSTAAATAARRSTRSSPRPRPSPRSRTR